jgi:hypothetical protein
MVTVRAFRSSGVSRATIFSPPGSENPQPCGELFPSRAAAHSASSPGRRRPRRFGVGFAFAAVEPGGIVNTSARNLDDVLAVAQDE